MSHLSLPRVFAGATLAVLLPLAGCSSEKAAPVSGAPRYELLVGCFTEGPTGSQLSKGVSVYTFDSGTGDLTLLKANEGIRNPAWLVLTEDAKFVYAVNELNGDGRAGEVSSFGFDAATGALKFINKVSSEGDNPCHLWLDPKGRRLFVSNYLSGNFAVLPLKSDGSLLPAEQTIADTRDDRGALMVAHIAKEAGGTRDEARAMGPGYAGKTSHVHSVTPLPDGTGIVAADLGWDRVIRHLYAPEVSGAKSLVLGGTGADAGGVKAFPVEQLTGFAEKTGPRHLVFSKDGKHAFVIGELNDSITTLGYTAGKLTQLSRVIMGAEPASGAGSAATIHLSPDGRFLYASVRNPKNAIYVYAVDAASGELKEVQNITSGGRAPREFSISPDGRHLLVANQATDSIMVFNRDPASGTLFPNGKRIRTGAPCDLKWVPIP